MSTKKSFTVAALHEAFGIEGSREYVGTERGAKAEAKKIAKAAGAGWRPIVSES